MPGGRPGSVAPVMSVEAVTAVALAIQPPPHLAASLLPATSVALVIAVWLSTGLVQVPLHERLAAGGGRDVVARLVRTNWLRTLIWTVRGAIAIMMLP